MSRPDTDTRRVLTLFPLVAGVFIAAMLSFGASRAVAEPFGMIAMSDISEPCSAFSSGGFRCGPGSASADRDNAFGSGIDTISVSVQHPSELGTFGSAYGNLDSGNGLPELFAYAQSVNGDGTFVSVESVNLFTYTGPDNFLLELTGVYSGTTTGIGAGMFGTIALISADDLDPATLMTDLDFGSSPSGCFGECYDPLDADEFETNGGGLEFFNLSASTTLNNGDQFYIYASFGGRAVGESVFDGLGTASFLLNTTDVVAATVIPLPASAWLLLSALGALRWTRRRRAS